MFIVNSDEFQKIRFIFPVEFEIFFDETYQFMLSVYFQIDSKKTSFREKELVETFTKLLVDGGVYEGGENLDQFTSKMSILKVEDGGGEEVPEATEVKKEKWAWWTDSMQPMA